MKMATMASKLFLVVFLLISSLANVAPESRQCSEDSHCSDLGGLKCIKSMCNFGLCGCQTGYAARFQGNRKKFQCVKVKRIGESCSTKNTDGVCGVSCSECVDGKCECTGGSEPYWDGELCLSISTPRCSASGQGTCSDTANVYGVGPVLPLGSLLDEQCQSCSSGYRMALRSDLRSGAPFRGRDTFVCEAIRIGEYCRLDSDCSQIRVIDAGSWRMGMAECIENACACPSSESYVSDITDLYCAGDISAGGACHWDAGSSIPASTSGVCDGSKGLRCGDPCDLDFATSPGNQTCVCDPGWKQEGTGTCARKTVGDSCFGDYNCKSLDAKAICVDGTCQDLATRAGLLTSVLFMALLLNII